MNILFVCTGNVSRSFLAEMLLKQAGVEHHILHMEVQSAGLFVNPDGDPDPLMVKYLEERKIPCGRHRSRAVTPELLAWADWVLVMEKIHLDLLMGMDPAAKDKLRLLGQYLPGNQQADEIQDPFGKSSYHYRLAQSQIVLAVKALADNLLTGKDL
jgi:protein-tyrosine phosphatase